jgi:hypothetical protein
MLRKLLKCRLFKPENNKPKTKTVIYYSIDKEKYVKAQIPIDMNIIDEYQTRIGDQIILAVEHEKRQINKKVKINQELQNLDDSDNEDVLNDIYDYYLENEKSSCQIARPLVRVSSLYSNLSIV